MFVPTFLSETILNECGVLDKSGCVYINNRLYLLEIRLQYYIILIKRYYEHIDKNVIKKGQ